MTHLAVFLKKGLPMKSFPVSFRQLMVLLAVPACLLTVAAPPAAFAKSPVKMTKLEGMVDVAVDAPFPYVLEGIASHLGKYQAYGEVTFLPGEEEGSMIGMGPVVFQAANGDLLVGMASWTIDPATDGVSNSHIHFAWQESVEFSDGTCIANTGRFVDNRPPGLIIDPKIFRNPIILILISIFS
jgi:hypothetical protein